MVSLSVVIPTLFSESALSTLPAILPPSHLASFIELVFVGPSHPCPLFSEFKSKLNYYSNKLGFNYILLSGSDSIYSAMNKGIDVSTGRYLFFSGDTDVPLYKNIFDTFNSLDSILFHSDDRPSVIVGSLLGIPKTSNYFPVLSPLSLIFERNPTPHQAVIYSKSVFVQYGYYTTSMRVMADYKFNLMLRYAVTSSQELAPVILEVNTPFCNFDFTGISSSPKLSNYLESYSAKSIYLSIPLRFIALICEYVVFFIKTVRVCLPFA